MFVSTIDNQAIEQCAPVVLGARIHTVSTLNQLEKAVAYLKIQPILGFDTETRPRFTAGKMYMTALLQLSSAEDAYLIHLKKTGIPPSLAAVLEDPAVLKVGAAVKDDILGLQRYASFNAQGFIDLQDMASTYGIVDKSVRKLAAIVLGRRVSKSQQTTNWEAFPLTEAQQQYAATDAYVCYQIYHALCDNPQEKKSPKERMYQEIITKMRALSEDEPNIYANLANAAALLKESFHFWWAGFYLVDKDLERTANVRQLVLGPYQGPIACTRIPYGRGVCGTAWKEARSIVVPNVEDFPGHIACNARSQSEIVIPLYDKAGQFAGVLDIDSERLATFDDSDRLYLEELVRLFQKIL